MAETVDELTVEYKEDDTVVVKELAKEVLTKGAWATVMYKYQDLDRKTNEFGPPKVTIRRYKKVSGRFMPQSKFNISSEKQAKQIVEILNNWF
ncbi:MAG: hypothetical protein OEY97_13170 [Nitrospirota bacterium]|nr:hypothetical protein [Nitrospirota bacterium]